MDVQGQVRDDQINQLEIMLLIMPPRRLCADGDDDGAGIVFSCSLFHVDFMRTKIRKWRVVICW